MTLPDFLSTHFTKPADTHVWVGSIVNMFLAAGGGSMTEEQAAREMRQCGYPVASRGKHLFVLVNLAEWMRMARKHGEQMVKNYREGRGL